MTRSRHALVLALFISVISVLLVGCGGDDDNPATTPTRGAGALTATEAPEKPVTLRLGYFANVTHAPAVLGVADGSFQAELGTNVKLQTKVFNAGPAAIEALFAGELDAAFIGPNPAINGFQKSNGQEVRIVAGAASGGALLIVRPQANINSATDLANKTIATPQLGNTQDVALRSYLRKNGLKPKDNGGNVTVLPTANADQLTLFQKGDIDGAWAPEPWATRLMLEAGGKVFLDEKSLWPNGQFVTMQLVVSAKFLKENPKAVERLVRAEVKATQFINANPEKARETVNKGIEQLTGKALSKATIDGAWKNLTFTYDPIASSLTKSARDAFDAGLLGRNEPNLKGIYQLDILNKVLGELNLPAVSE
ncbi:MAG: ABC transporter substrate-binding protein [Anaerolineaceae bacterium]